MTSHPMTRVMLVVAALLTSLALTAVSAADKPRDISGTYTDDRVTLVLKVDMFGDSYDGTLTVDGKTYPVSLLTSDGKSLFGGFKVGKDRFEIDADMQPDGGMILKSGKAKYTLKHKDGPLAPAQPVPGHIGGIPPAQPPAGGVGEIPPGPAADGPALPAFMKAGYRIYWSKGNSTSEGASLVPDPNGLIERNGKRYSLRGHMGRGAEGIQVVTVQEATPQGILADSRMFSIAANLQGKTLSTTSNALLAGNGAALGDFWVNPAVLAQIPLGRDIDGATATRVLYTALNKQFNALSIFRMNDAGSGSFTYDMESGLLLAGYRSDRSPDFSVQSPDGTYKYNGSVAIERWNLLGSRQVEFPGIAEPAPAWATKGLTLEYRGSFRSEMQQQGPYVLPQQPGFPLAIGFVFQGGTKNTMVAQWTLVRNVDRGGINDLPQQGVRCFGNAMYFGSLWMSPALIAKLQPNAVLDADQITGYRTTFAGVRGSIAVIVEQGPNETTECYFDVRSGMLMGWKNGVQLIPGISQVSELQVVRRQ